MSGAGGPSTIYSQFEKNRLKISVLLYKAMYFSFTSDIDQNQKQKKYIGLYDHGTYFEVKNII